MEDEISKDYRKREASYTFAKRLLEELITKDWTKENYERLKDGYLQGKVSFEDWERYVKEKSEDKLQTEEDLTIECFQYLLQRQEQNATERIVEFIESKNSIYTTRDDLKAEVWRYEEGIYLPNGESYIKEVVRRILKKAYTSQLANKVISKIQADTQIDIDKFFGVNYLDEICVRNGILNLKTRELQDFTPEKIFFNKIPVEYNPEAKCENINRFFEEVLASEDDKCVLYELIGFCLHKDYFIEKAFMFLGSGRNGKGKTLALIKTFLGVENTCSVRLLQMESNSTALCELHNRLVNLAGDLSNTSLKDTGLFKELTGRDSVQVKRKYLRDLIFVNYAKMVFACNELPRVYDLSEGFWSRWVLLEFPYQFLPLSEIESRTEKEKAFCKVQNPQILDNLTTSQELSGLLNQALDGLDRLKQNKNFSYSRGTANIKDFWIRKSDTFMAFCLDNLEIDSESLITKKELRNRFVKYCKLHQIKGASDNAIKVVLEDLFGAVSNRKMYEMEQEWVWEGVKFKVNLVNSKGCYPFPTNPEISNPYTSSETLATLTIHQKNKENLVFELKKFAQSTQNIPIGQIKQLNFPNLDEILDELQKEGRIFYPQKDFVTLLD